MSEAHFFDPGNDVYCLLLHILRLDKYIFEGRIKEIIKTPATEYGSARNQSSVGVVNFRGNIIEALLSDLQKKASAPAKGQGKKGAGNKSSKW